MIRLNLLYYKLTIRLILPTLAISPELIDLLPRILEKNPVVRYSLLNIKDHPWLTLDLTPKEQEVYFKETNPELQSVLDVTDQEVQSAVNILTTIRTNIRKFSTSFINFTHTFTQKRSESMSTDLSLIKTKSNVSWLSGDPTSTSNARHSVDGGTSFMPRHFTPMTSRDIDRSLKVDDTRTQVSDSQRDLDHQDKLMNNDNEDEDASEKRRLSEWSQAYVF